jgi:hypothetical protein
MGAPLSVKRWRNNAYRLRPVPVASVQMYRGEIMGGCLPHRRVRCNVFIVLRPVRMWYCAVAMSQPNLLFIMTDQQRYDALGANGNPVIQTPNMDALARDGANVHGYYTNCPVCVPSRCTLFTGRYPHSHRVRENHNLLEYGREIHLFRVLRQAGYALGYTGKNHLLEVPEMENFDFVGGLEESEAPLREWYQQYRQSLRDRGQPEIWRAGAFHDFPPETTRTWATARTAPGFSGNVRKTGRSVYACRLPTRMCRTWRRASLSLCTGRRNSRCTRGARANLRKKRIGSISNGGRRNPTGRGKPTGVTTWRCTTR